MKAENVGTSDRSHQKSEISVSAEFTDQDAWDLALFFKRVGFTNYRSHAIDDAEVYRMFAAGEKNRKAFAECGSQPR